MSDPRAPGPRPDLPPAPPGGDGRRMKAVLVAVAALGFAGAPFATAGFGGFAPDLFPIPQDNPPVQPAGYAFAIWGPIYAGLLAHAAFGLLARAEAPAWDRGRWPLVLSLGVGAGWIAAANANAALATVMIWIMLAGALGALARSGPSGGWPQGAADRWVGQLPLGVYAGWLTAAAWVAVGFMLGGYGVTGPVWAAALAVAGATATAVVTQLSLPRAPEYGLTVGWALLALAVTNLGRHGLLVLLSLAGLGILGATLRRVLR